MKLEQALFTAGMHFKDGDLYENGDSAPLGDAGFAKIVAATESTLHDAYISPMTTVKANQWMRYHRALEVIAEFQTLKPTLDKLGIKY